MIVFLIAGFVGGGLCGYLFHGGNPDGEYEEKVTITPTPEAILTTAPKGTETPEATPTSTPTPKTTEKTESSEALTAAPAKQKNAVDVDKIIENII